MADLRQSLHRLVEQPLAQPASVEGIAERARTFARRRQLQRSGAALLLAAIVGTASLVVTRDGDDGISVAAEGVTSAGYIAEARGGYIATGTWKLTITRGTQVIELSGPSSPHCGPIGLIQPGDEVRGSIVGPDSTLRVGEKFRCPG